MLGSFAEPRLRLDFVLVYALAVAVKNSEAVLRVSIPLFRSFAKPNICLRVILLNAPAKIVRVPNAVL